MEEIVKKMAGYDLNKNLAWIGPDPCEVFEEEC
jgi:hypothetical protein